MKKYASRYGIVLVTFKDIAEARKVAAHLLQKRLAACCNLITPVESSFWWKGKVQREKEVLGIFKTKKTAFNFICQEIKKHHSYEVPEILALPLRAGAPAYLKWMKEVLI